MKNKIVSGNGKTYRRLTKSSARKAFESGGKLYVMSIDRDPISSFSSPYIYYNGCKSLCGWFNGNTEITTFDELLEDLKVNTFNKYNAFMLKSCPFSLDKRPTVNILIPS